MKNISRSIGVSLVLLTSFACGQDSGIPAQELVINDGKGDVVGYSFDPTPSQPEQKFVVRCDNIFFGCDLKFTLAYDAVWDRRGLDLGLADVEVTALSTGGDAGDAWAYALNEDADRNTRGIKTFTIPGTGYRKETYYVTVKRPYYIGVPYEDHNHWTDGLTRLGLTISVSY